MPAWLLGCLAAWLLTYLHAFLPCCLAIWLLGCLAARLLTYLHAFRSCCLVVWLLGCLAAYLLACLYAVLPGYLAVWLLSCLAAYLPACLRIAYLFKVCLHPFSKLSMSEFAPLIAFHLRHILREMGMLREGTVAYVRVVWKKTC